MWYLLLGLAVPCFMAYLYCRYRADVALRRVVYETCRRDDGLTNQETWLTTRLITKWSKLRAFASLSEETSLRSAAADALRFEKATQIWGITAVILAMLAALTFNP